jgi:putative flippase GtrA
LIAFARKNKEVERFWKFAVVGAIGFVIDFGISNLLWLLLPKNLAIRLPLGLVVSSIGLGGAIGFITAITSNFFWNRYWTYPDSRSKSLLSQFALFFVINLMGIVIRIPILELASRPLAALTRSLLPGLGVEYLTFLGADAAAGAGKNAALVIAVIVVMFWNFFVNRYTTYNDVK